LSAEEKAEQENSPWVTPSGVIWRDMAASFP